MRREDDPVFDAIGALPGKRSPYYPLRMSPRSAPSLPHPRYFGAAVRSPTCIKKDARQEGDHRLGPSKSSCDGSCGAIDRCRRAPIFALSGSSNWPFGASYLCAPRACAEIGDSPQSRCGNTRYPFRGTPKGAYLNCSELDAGFSLSGALHGLPNASTVRQNRATLRDPMRPMRLRNMFARSVESEEQDETNRGKGTQHLKLVGQPRDLKSLFDGAE